MKKILGLDLGTNSIGWALVDADEKKILGMGSRIIPMTQDVLDIFSGGKPLATQTAERTRYRSVRRLIERGKLRRERLHRVLNVLNFLPKHYAKEIDFEKHFGQFFDETEPKLAWKKNTETEKLEFIFQKSFNEMADDFKANGQETKIPYDWTIYYLRKKALTQKIDKEELAWLLLNFNQKRGYYQLRGEEEEENPNKLVEFYSLKIIDVVADEQPNSKGDTWYSLHLENGWVYRRSSKTPMFDWKDKTHDFIVTTDLNDDGTIKTNKDGVEKRSFRAPSENDWTLLKKKTEVDIEHSQKTVGTYIYETLLQKPNQKIRGKLVRTIERKFYKDELIAILKKQIELQPELFTDDLYNNCVRELYRSNEAHQFVLSKRDFLHLFVNDILFYQRPLRSQKSSIGNCTLEFRKHKDKDGNEITEYLKAVPKSNPLYQEFRVWQWLSNLKILTKDNDKDVTELFIKNIDDKTALFEFLMTKKEVNHIDILKYFLTPIIKEKFSFHNVKAQNKELEKELVKYRWNYVFDDSKDKEEDKSKKYPCNETGYEIRNRLKKVENVPADFLTAETEYQLWHIIYSVTDKNEFEKALKTFAEKHNLNENSFIENFKKFLPFKSEYGAFSEKAIKKLLPLMRLGKHWKWENIDAKTQEKIGKIISGEYDETIKERVREKAINLTENNHFQGLPLWLASYVVYSRHSEANIADKWNSIADLEKYLENFKQHSLHNPIVEQIIMETLRVVRDIWKKHGNFAEIHVELGRQMKQTAEQRAKDTTKNTDNENTNLRIKALLMELKNDNTIENVRPYSPIQQEILKIYEDGVLQSNIEIPDDILKISKAAQPTKSELLRYKLWLEQKYRSPYTGQMIPLGELFTEKYQIEHIIPKSRYFDDSFNNKIICEAAVNQLKDKQLGLEFIKNHFGQEVELGFGKNVKIFTENDYRDFVQEHYAKNRIKKSNLLLDEIPDKMIARQMNDTRYISKFICGLLSNIVRAEKDDDGINSKNLIPTNGKITTTLKQDWGLNDIWNDLIMPRFERMNKLTDSENFTSKNTNGKDIPNVPLELQKGFQKKRIDHRHHAMDALVIACATRSHINYLNNISAKIEASNNEEKKEKQLEVRNQMKNTLCYKTKLDEKGNYKWQFNKPWDTFTENAKAELEKIVISFKQNLRVINKATNKYEKIKDGKKAEEKQKGVNWAIRKPLHKETIYAKVDLPFVKVPKDKIVTASRVNLDVSFDESRIEKITDTGIQKILKNYLATKDNKPEVAFSPEGIEEMNNNISAYNDGKPHKPILKVRTFEIGNRFALGTKGNKKDKYVEAAKGTNLFFAVYADENGNRSFETIPLNIVIERLKQGLKEVPETNEKGHSLLFSLSPNDLVYIPTEEEMANGIINNENLDVKRIYKMVSSSGTQCFFVQQLIANSIVNKVEFSALNKMERSIEGIMIKDVCVKLKVDRLGNIKRYNYD